MSLAWTTSPLWLIVNALVAYRLTRLWTEDSLPPLPRLRWRIRHHLEVRLSRRDQDTREDWIRYYGGHPLEPLLDCAWCAGFWISLAVFLAASLIPLTIWAFLAVPLALSAVVGLLAVHT